MADQPLQVKQFRYASDNLGYLIYGQNSAMAIDGGAVDEMLEFIDANAIRLDYVTQTHTHPDHMLGHQPLMDHTGAAHLDSQALSNAKELALEGQKIQLEKYDPDCVCSSLEEERKMNPFLRFNHRAIISILKAKALPHATEYERWVSVMSLP